MEYLFSVHFQSSICVTGTVFFFLFNLSVTLPFKSALGCLAGLDLKPEIQAGGVGICISKICPPPSAGKTKPP